MFQEFQQKQLLDLNRFYKKRELAKNFKKNKSSNANAFHKAEKGINKFFLGIIQKYIISPLEQKRLF